MTFVFITLTVLVIAWVLRAVGLGSQSSLSVESPLDVLKRRLARGEIDGAEYEERRTLLANSSLAMPASSPALDDRIHP